MKEKLKKEKLKTTRVCFTLPEIMLDQFKAYSAETGLSVSKVILRILSRKKEKVCLLPTAFTREIEIFNRLVAQALAAKDLTPELKAQLKDLRHYVATIKNITEE